MFACTYTNFFWIKIKTWLEGFQIKTDYWNEFEVVIAVLKHKHFNLVNHLLIIGKQVIYSCRMKK